MINYHLAAPVGSYAPSLYPHIMYPLRVGSLFTALAYKQSSTIPHIHTDICTLFLSSHISTILNPLSQPSLNPTRLPPNPPSPPSLVPTHPLSQPSLRRRFSHNPQPPLVLTPSSQPFLITLPHHNPPSGDISLAVFGDELSDMGRAAAALWFPCTGSYIIKVGGCKG